jgi:uncharacterized protein
VTLRQRLKTEITAAMRSGDALRRDTLRMAENSIYNAEKRDRRTFDDDEVAAIIAKEAKTRRESVEAFRAGGREDLAAKEEAEIEILGAFLPEQLSDAELESLVTEALAATGAATPREMGKAMAWLAPRTRGRADGRRVSEMVGRRLAELAGAGR